MPPVEVTVAPSGASTTWMQRAADKPELLKSFIAAQKKFEVPKRTKTANAGKYSYTYSSLDEVIAATRPALTDNGLGCFQNVTMPGLNVVCVSTVLVHDSGQIVESDPLIFQVDGSPQSAGAAITYGRRYSMSAMLGVASEEDTDAARDERAGKQQQGKQPPPILTPEEEAAAKADGDKPISEAQVNRLKRIVKQAGVTGKSMKAWLESMEIKTSADIKRNQYENIVLAVQGGKVPKA